jgi:hypothetical protein
MTYARRPGLWVIVIGLLGVWVGTSESQKRLWGLIVPSIVAIGVGALMLIGGKKRYSVTIVSSTVAGETDALTSEDPEYIRKVVEAINEAIVRH